MIPINNQLGGWIDLVNPWMSESSNRRIRSYVLAVSMQTSNVPLARSPFGPLLDGSFSDTPTQATVVASYLEDRELVAESDSIFRLAASEVFEDGMENRTSQSLSSFVFRYSAAGVQHLATRLLSESMNQSTAADIVRVLGRIEHQPSHNDRVYIAECLLYSELPFARDAGAVALSDLADERSIPALQRAIESEGIPGLKADMMDSLKELAKARDGTRP